jgi:hypothetical protein
VAVIGANGAVAFHDVTIASDDGNLVTIGSGLRDGDQVALNLSSQVSAGEIVKLNNASGGNTRSASSAL